MGGGGGSVPFGPVGPDPGTWAAQVGANSAARTQAAYNDLGLGGGINQLGQPSSGMQPAESKDIAAGYQRAQLDAGQLGILENQAALQQQQAAYQLKNQSASSLGGLLGSFS